MRAPRTVGEWVHVLTLAGATWIAVHGAVFGPRWLYFVALLMAAACGEIARQRRWIRELEEQNERLRVRAREYLVESVRARLMSGLPTITRERAREERG